jgi:hypothetical protein
MPIVISGTPYFSVIPGRAEHANPKSSTSAEQSSGFRIAAARHPE